MHSQCPHYHVSNNATGNVFPVRALTAYNFLRSYNHLFTSQTSDLDIKYGLPVFPSNFPPQPIPNLIHSEKSCTSSHHIPIKPYNSTQLFQIPCHGNSIETDNFLYPNNDNLNTVQSHSKRQRGEKRPIPDNQKDEKYYERRRKNNEAAKKSRDARKFREDQAALKATFLEHENTLLKAQVLTLREEASSLRQLLLQKKSLELEQVNGQDLRLCNRR